jgi:hypothetical protein
MGLSWRLLGGVALLAAACATDAGAGGGGGGSSAGGVAGASGGTGGGDAATGATAGTGGGVNLDASSDAPPIDPDAACAVATEQAQVQILPVDIIWMVDNSISMQPAIDEVTKGLNAFANLIGGKNLDYKVIMLSYRSKTSPVTVNGSQKYAVCIPPPLAGDTNCGNGPRFFQSSIDVLSTQPLEQFLGTLGQTTGYMPGDPRGGEPWKDQLRPAATRTIVVVTDDNARLSAQDFESFAGGKNPFNSLMLPPGILQPFWNGLFDGYVFNALYGWGSETDPTVKCQYPGGATPPSSGQTYTTLVQKTGGARAQICAGAAAWGPFFDAVAKAVEKGSKLSCELALPTPSTGTLDPGKVNVRIVDSSGVKDLYKVAGQSACDQSGGWYYDNDAQPTKVILCPSSCQAAEQAGAATGNVKIEVLFGCVTIVK